MCVHASGHVRGCALTLNVYCKEKPRALEVDAEKQFAPFLPLPGARADLFLA